MEAFNKNILPREVLGTYSSDATGEGIPVDESEAQWVMRMRMVIQEGLDSGVAVEFDPVERLRELNALYVKKVRM